MKERLRALLSLMDYAGLRCAVALTAAGIVAYLALRASPWLGEISWLPRWLGAWADNHGNLRNLPAFAGLTVLLVWAAPRTPACRRAAIALTSLLAAGLESAQVLIAGRTFDWADIAWSLLGVALASLALAGLRRLRADARP